MKESMIPVTPVAPVAPWLGGKRNLAKRICKMLDAIPCTTYAEPFVGMGGIFLRRSTRPRAEVINDYGRDVANMFAGGPRGTICSLIWPTGADVTSRIYVADSSDNNPNLYGTNTAFRAYSADVENADSNIAARRHCLIMTWDHTVTPGLVSLYTNTDVVSGTTTRTRAVGEGIIGSFGSNTNFMIGYMAANIVLNEDVSRSPAVLNLLQTYARAEARTN